MDIDYAEIFEALDSRSKVAVELLNILELELSLPNIPMPTMGGEVFWTNIAEHNGWKIQQNMFTHHARILDSNNVRIAWGTINGMTKALDRMSEYLHKYDEPASTSSDRMAVMEELKQLKELLDIGAITEMEYTEKKQKLMKLI